MWSSGGMVLTGENVEQWWNGTDWRKCGAVVEWYLLEKMWSSGGMVLTGENVVQWWNGTDWRKCGAMVERY